MRKLAFHQIGPYSAYEAEWLTERTLDSKVTYQLFEQLYRGDISQTEFDYRIMFLVESLHCDFLEEQGKQAQWGHDYE